MDAIKIPVIKEREYQSFRCIGLISHFPREYNEFMKNFEEEKKKFCNGKRIPIGVNVNFSDFITWFGVGKTATLHDLFRYTASVF